MHVLLIDDHDGDLLYAALNHNEMTTSTHDKSILSVL